MRQIAVACRIPLGSIYNYIGTKDDILHLICENASISWRPDLEETIRNYKGESITELLRECIAVYFKIADEIKDQNGFFNREIRNFSSEDRHTLLASQAEIVFLFEEILQRGIKTGEFKMSSPVCVAHNILMAGNIWGERKWFLKPRFTFEGYTKLQTEILLNGIQANGRNQ